MSDIHVTDINVLVKVYDTNVLVAPSSDVVYLSQSSDSVAVHVDSSGPQGAPGLQWRDVWDELESYSPGDAISWRGSSFICIEDNVNEEPPNPSYWGLLAGGSEEGESMPYALELDASIGGVTYVGEASPGAATSSAAWRIKRITESSGDVTIEWADGNALFDNIWDNRSSLTYS